MGAAEARHFQRIRHAAAGFFRQRLDFRIGIIVGDHHRIALLEQGFDLFAIKGFFGYVQRNRFRREGIHRRIDIKHFTHRCNLMLGWAPAA